MDMFHVPMQPGLVVFYLYKAIVQKALFQLQGPLKKTWTHIRSHEPLRDSLDQVWEQTFILKRVHHKSANRRGWHSQLIYARWLFTIMRQFNSTDFIHNKTESGTSQNLRLRPAKHSSLPCTGAYLSVLVTQVRICFCSSNLWWSSLYDMCASKQWKLWLFHLSIFRHLEGIHEGHLSHKKIRWVAILLCESLVPVPLPVLSHT